MDTLKIFLSLSLLLVISGCDQKQQKNVLGNAIENNVLRVGTVYGQSTYYNDSNGPAGFEYELLQGFANHIGASLELFPYYNISELLAQVEIGQIHVAAAGLPLTARQLSLFDVGPVYHSVDQKLVYQQGKKRPRKWQDVTLPLTVVTGTSHIDELQQVQTQHSHVKWIETAQMDEEEILLAIKTGEIEYTITDSDTLALMRRRYPEISVGFSIKNDASISWLLPKSLDDSLQAELFNYFEIINKNGVLSQLKEKYFSHIELFNYVDTRAFIKASETTLPSYIQWFKVNSQTLDWRLLAALAYQESHWNPKARSPTGVRGLMMLTLDTAKDWGVTSRLDAKQNIIAGGKYLNSLVKRLPARIEYPDRLWFALAAYNIGMGHLEDARVITQRQGGNPDLWIDVKQRLPLLRQKKYYKNTRYGYARGDEATVYVANIRRYYDTLSYLFPSTASTVMPASVTVD